MAINNKNNPPRHGAASQKGDTIILRSLRERQRVKAFFSQQGHVQIAAPYDQGIYKMFCKFYIYY